LSASAELRNGECPYTARDKRKEMPPTHWTAQRIAATIDHTILKAEATAADVDKLCAQAAEFHFAAVCVNPVFVGRCAKHLAGTRVAVAGVCGFPLGATTTTDKAEEARRAVEAGATEIDMVIHLGAMLTGDTNYVRDDMAAVVDAARRANPDAHVKAILETAALTDDQIIAACRCGAEAQVDYVKTSTGFHASGGASLDAVRLMHKHAAPIKVKASGGIRDRAAAIAMLEAGASRIGTSSGVNIIQESP
jgi:deoxyribose-phosphate aldolase